MPSSSHPASDPSRTLTTQKRQFLTSQIRLLCTPLIAPSSQTLNAVNCPAISQVKLDSITSKTNLRIKQHNQLVFPVQSQRHVLEQIEGVYWRDALEKVYDTESAEILRAGKYTRATTIHRHQDLSHEAVMRNLPVRWDDVILNPDRTSQSQTRASKRRRTEYSSPSEEQEETSLDDDEEQDVENLNRRAKEYTALHTALIHQQERRALLRQKLKRYRYLAALLEPYARAKEDIQPNLAGKGGELETELERLAELCTRVHARGGINLLRARRGGIEPKHVQQAATAEGTFVTKTQSEKEKLEYILGLNAG